MKNLIKKLLNEGYRKMVLLEELSLLIEKEITVGGDLKKKLNDIDKPYAKKLLQDLSSKNIPDDVDIYTVEYSDDDNKTLTAYSKDRNGKFDVRKYKIGKLLKRLGINLSGYQGWELEELVSHLKRETSEEMNNFEVVDGEKILWAYHCDNFDESKGNDGNLSTSCMRHDKAQTYFKIYTENPEQVKCLVLINPNNGKVRGRALIWKMDDGTRFIDEVYVMNNQYKSLFNAYIKNNNLSTTTENFSSVTLTNGGEYNKYPYMDTFQYYTPDEGILSKGKEDNTSIELRDTEGGVTGQVKIEYGTYEDERINTEDARLIDYSTTYERYYGYAHSDDCVLLEPGRYGANKYVLKDDAVELHDGGYALRGNLHPSHEDRDDEDTYNGGIVQLYDGDYAYDDEVKPLFDGYYDGNYGLKSEVVPLYPSFYGDDVYALNDDVLKINLPYDGEYWVLKVDGEEFEEYIERDDDIDGGYETGDDESGLKSDAQTVSDFEEYDYELNEGKGLIKKLVRRRLTEDFQELNDAKWDEITNTIDAYEITNTYDLHDIIDFIVHYDSEYFGYNLGELIRGVNDNPKLHEKPYKKLYLELLLKEKTGSLSNDERKELMDYIDNKNNDYPTPRKDIYR